MKIFSKILNITFKTNFTNGYYDIDFENKN